MNTPRKTRLRVQLALSGEVGDAIADLAERATAAGAGRPQRLQSAMRAIAYDCLCAGLEAVADSTRRAAAPGRRSGSRTGPRDPGRGR